MFYAATALAPERTAELSGMARQAIEATLHLSHRAQAVPGPVRERAAHILTGWWSAAEINDVTRDDLAQVFAITQGNPMTAAAIDAAVRVERRHAEEICAQLCRANDLTITFHQDCPVHGTGGLVP